MILTSGIDLKFVFLIIYLFANFVVDVYSVDQML